MSQSITKSVLETPKSCRHFRKGFLFIVCAVFVPLQFLPGTFLIPKSASIVYVPLTCSFRDYDHDPDRLYGITSKDYPPPFLRTSFYIYGKPPVLLPIATRSDKVCSRGEALVMDGTNPSMLSLSKLRNQLPSNTSAFWNRFPDASYLVSSTFKGNHQCKYIPRKKRKKTTLESTLGRKTRVADLLIVNSQIQTLWQSHIWNSETVGSDEALQYSADDVRIFLHDGNLWMSYKRYPVIREGIPRSVQRINRLWFGHHGVEVVAMADPAFEINLCCGRNFGMLPPSVEGKLSFLTWPDPVCVHSLDTRSVLSSGNYLVDFEEPIHIKSRMPNKKPSEFHGTSNQLLFIADWNEYLGIGHFHRERKWNGDKRIDAAFGHHYTHSFFTISAQRPHHLKRLSQEFLFPSQVNPADADIIQFASGLEWDTPTGIIIGYGINDCEGAIVRVDWNTVISMLKTVENGTQVAHTMRNMTREQFH